MRQYVLGSLWEVFQLLVPASPEGGGTGAVEQGEKKPT